MIVKLGSLISEYSVRNKADEDIPVYSVTNEQGFCTGYFSKEVASQDRTTYKIVPRGCFAYNPSRINVGSVDVQECEDRVIVSPLYVVFSVDEKLNRRYLLHYLKSDITLTYIKAYASGSVRDNLKFSILKDFPINLPSAEEQEQIVATLDGIEHLIALRKEELASLDELVKSRFIELFESGNYPVCRLGDVCSKITDGTHKTPNYLDAGVTFISAKNIVNGELDFSDVKYISDQEYAEIQKRCQTEMGDILLSKSGSLGAPVIVKTTERIGLFESLAVIKYDRSKLLPAFLCEQLKSDRIQRQFKVGTKGVAIKHLHLGVIADTDIVVPPIKDQNAFAAFVEQTDKSKLAVQKALEELEILKKSLMQQYFG